MSVINEINQYAEQLPDKEIADFHGELVCNIAHDERSWGPTAFTFILSQNELATDNNPKSLYVSVVNEATEEDKSKVAKEAFHYFQGILKEHFYQESSDNLLTLEDISEEDLPF